MGFFLDLSGRSYGRCFDQAFGFVEDLQLRPVLVGILLGFTAEQTLDQ